MRASDSDTGTVAAGRTARTRTPRQYDEDAVQAHSRETKVAKGRTRKPSSDSKDAFVKVSVTMPGAVLDEARRRAATGGLSAYLTAAVEAQLATERLKDLIEELDAEYGPVPEAMVSEAAAAWPNA